MIDKWAALKLWHFVGLWNWHCHNLFAKGTHAFKYYIICVTHACIYISMYIGPLVSCTIDNNVGPHTLTTLLVINITCLAYHMLTHNNS